MNHDVMKAPTKEQAVADLLSRWTFQPETEYVLLADCLGRVTAEEIHSVYTLPLLRVSAMDGFAVHSEAFAEGNPDPSGWVLGKDYAPADTGDDFPDEFDAVVAVEDLNYGENGVLRLREGYEFKGFGQNTRPAGSTMRKGDLLISPHTVITPELQASLAIGGIRMVLVYRKLKVAFIPTGSELTPAGLQPLRGQNIECNSLLLSAYLRQWGADPIVFPIVRDDPAELERVLDEALPFADVVLLNGGSSKGGEDYTSRMLEKRGTYFAHTVRAVPGRPVGISLIEGKPVINIPGPTLAAWLVNDWLVHSIVCRYYGIPMPAKDTIQAELTEAFKSGPPIEVNSRVKVEKRNGDYYVTPLGRGAGSAEALREGIGIITSPVGNRGWQKGEKVTVRLLRGREWIEGTERVLPSNCDQCPNHCPAEMLKCGRGRARFEKLRAGEKNFHSDDPLVQLIVDCGDTAKHKSAMIRRFGHDEKELFSALTEEERSEMISLLQKQKAQWEKEHAQRHAQRKNGASAHHMGEV